MTHVQASQSRYSIHVSQSGPRACIPLRFSQISLPITTRSNRGRSRQTNLRRTPVLRCKYLLLYARLTLFDCNIVRLAVPIHTQPNNSTYHIPFKLPLLLPLHYPLLLIPLPRQTRHKQPNHRNPHQKRQNNRLQNLHPLTLRNRPHRKRQYRCP